jgi:hypothetical protein
MAVREVSAEDMELKYVSTSVSVSGDLRGACGRCSTQTDAERMPNRIGEDSRLVGRALV